MRSIHRGCFACDQNNEFGLKLKSENRIPDNAISLVAMTGVLLILSEKFLRKLLEYRFDYT